MDGIVGWTVTKQKLCPQIANSSSSSFWQGTLPPYHQTFDNDDISIASPESFHSIEDGGEKGDNPSTQDNMILFDSIMMDCL
jgi:hypothetical protein